MTQDATAVEKSKEIRDGMVAILYSPGHGAGWYTWNQIRGEDWDPTWLLFDAQLVHLFEQKNAADWVTLICDYCDRTYPGMYTGGVEDVTIAWLPVDTKFIINEYDGSESIQTIEDTDWLIA